MAWGWRPAAWTAPISSRLVIRLRLLTANLWAHHSEPEGLARVLREVDPDLLAVQELQQANADVIARRYAHHGLAPHHDTLGNGVASRYPTTISRLPLRYRSGWSMRLEPAEWHGIAQPVELINLHLANPVGWPWSTSVKNRRYQVDATFDHVDRTPMARVLVGDFNASPMWPAYRRLADRFTDAAVATNTAERTWRFHGRTPPLLRIDHAFGHGVTFIHTEPIEIPGADHLGLVVDFEV